MKWTTKPPTEEGWYWVHGVISGVVTMMEIYRSVTHPDEWRGACFGGDREFKRWGNLIDKWAGPIPEPEDTDA